jgi:transcriptional regulator with XRE-family HTH domain
MAITDSEGLIPSAPIEVAPIGERLKALREADGAKLAAVAKVVGTTIATLSAVETSRIANPGYQLVYSLARYYGVSVEELINGPSANDASMNKTEKLAQRLTPDEDEMASSYLKFLIAQRAQR